VYVWLPATHLEPGVVPAQGAPLAGVLGVGRYPSGADALIERLGADWTRAGSWHPSRDVMRWKHGKLPDNLNNGQLSRPAAG
jgi:2-dehydropantoate 2-reductase